MKGLVYFALGVVAGVFGYRYYIENFESESDGGLYEEEEEKPRRKKKKKKVKEEDDIIIDNGRPKYDANMTHVDYNKMYREPTKEELEKAAVEEERAENSFLNIHSNDYPEIVEPEDLGTIPPEVTEKTLTFYHDDETLVDDETGTVIDRDLYVGDCLEMYDEKYKGTFVDSRKPQIYVINYQHGVLYDVHRVNGSYDGL